MNDKEHLRELFKEFKEETLEKNKKLIDKYVDDYKQNLQLSCDLLKDKISVEICETKEQKQRWTAYVHLTTSLPWRGSVGRQVKLFIKCNNHILGMVHLVSPLAQSKVRDEYLNFENKWEQLKGVYNIETCVATPKYSNLLTGKLLIYIVFSNVVVEYLEAKYGDKVIGFETTSLYGKSSIYNRIPFFKYLGLTEGLSAVYLKDEEWTKLYEEYKQVFPNTKTNRLAPVKFQIVDKLSRYYAKHNMEFPYTYKSESFRRGVYFGYVQDKSLTVAINEWRNRWLIGRMNRLEQDAIACA